MTALKGQLPKAYLRVDPNLDQTHPDPGGFMRLLCAAARQPQRGRFKSRHLLDGILGRPLAKRLAERGDVAELKDKRWYVVGWDEWQEGDLTVGERQRRIRARRVTEPLDESDGAVTEPLHHRDSAVTQPLDNRDSPSEAVRQQGSKAADALAGARRARESGPEPIGAIIPDAVASLKEEVPPDVNRLQLLAEELTGQPYVMGNVYGGLGAKAVNEQLQRHGFDRTARAWWSVANRTKAEGTSAPTLRQLVLGADDLLNPIPQGMDKEARAEETAADFDRRVARTRKETAPMRAHLEGQT